MGRAGQRETPKSHITATSGVTFPSGFSAHHVSVNGVNLHYVVGGAGPAIVLVHGFPQDWSEFYDVMEPLAKTFTVIAVDLPGLGESSESPAGYDAATIAADLHELASHLGLERPYIVGHDIGGSVAYALARTYPQDLRGAMILDTPIAGVAGWDEAMNHPSAWHVHFMQVPGLAEKLLAGRHADFLTYFFSFGRFTPEQIARHLQAYSQPRQFGVVLDIYRAFPQNVAFNAAQKTPNDLPILFATGDGSPFAKLIPTIASGLRANGCTHIETALIRDSVHYLFQDQPQQLVEFIQQHAA